MRRGSAALGTFVLCASGVITSEARAWQASSKELAPSDFAYGAQVLTSGEGAAYRASLPLAVYQKVVRGDLGDVRVFNERGEAVPYRIERPSSQFAVQSLLTSLPLFTLRGDPRATMDAIRISIESGATRIEVQAPAAGATTSSPVASYIVDGRILLSPLAAFKLVWPEDAADFAGRLRVEASDDFGYWRTVATGAPVANLRAGDARITESRVEIVASTAKFWRFSWVDTPAPFEIKAVLAEPARDRKDVERVTLAVPGAPIADERGEFVFDLGAQVPVDRVNLELPEQNSIVEVELLSRASPNEAWQSATRNGFYRLKSTGSADHTNAPVLIGPISARYWLARVDMRSGGLGRNAPQLRVGWLPHDVVFLARGVGPFTLAYGNANAQTVAALGSIPANVSILNARLAEPHTLGGNARLASAKPATSFWSKSAVLWTVLAVGVALLTFMAYRLAGELKDKP